MRGPGPCAASASNVSCYMCKTYNKLSTCITFSIKRGLPASWVPATYPCTDADRPWPVHVYLSESLYVRLVRVLCACVVANRLHARMRAHTQTCILQWSIICLMQSYIAACWCALLYIICDWTKAVDQNDLPHVGALVLQFLLDLRKIILNFLLDDFFMLVHFLKFFDFQFEFLFNISNFYCSKKK